MKTNQSIVRRPDQSPNYSIFIFLGTTTVCLIAVWGVAVALSFYMESQMLMRFAHFPFWMMIGSLGILLNSIPISKSKPKLIPLLAIMATIATVAWFCFDNFIEISGIEDIFDRVRLGAGLLIVCYCLTHISLLMLTYQKGNKSYLLITTSALIVLSGLTYVSLLSGFVRGELFVFILTSALILFFTKIALTIATVIVSLNPYQKSSNDDNHKPSSNALLQEVERRAI